ncbi:MAG: hypothetical protein JWR18_846 [Segetibacter sp.]|jgi:hypothetical protein|nr:hypothetical protein [Segetibacter sp.]
MQSELINEQSTLLNEIISEVEKMDVEEKKKLLIKLRKEDILAKVNSLDKVTGVAKENAMTDEQADDYISEQRKLRYEESKT